MAEYQVSMIGPPENNGWPFSFPLKIFDHGSLRKHTPGFLKQVNPTAPTKQQQHVPCIHCSRPQLATFPTIPHRSVWKVEDTKMCVLMCSFHICRQFLAYLVALLPRSHLLKAPSLASHMCFFSEKMWIAQAKSQHHWPKFVSQTSPEVVRNFPSQSLQPAQQPGGSSVTLATLRKGAFPQSTAFHPPALHAQIQIDLFLKPNAGLLKAKRSVAGRGFICARVQLVICTRVMFRIHGNHRQIGPVICARGNNKGRSRKGVRVSRQPHPPPIVHELESPPPRFPPTLTIHPPPSPLHGREQCDDLHEKRDSSVAQICTVRSIQKLKSNSTSFTIYFSVSHV